MKFEGFIGGSYESQAVTADQERTINWYPEMLESQGATAQRVLYPVPGVEELSDPASDVLKWGRAHIYIGGREFMIIGSVLYEGLADGTTTSRGTVPGVASAGATPCTISSSGDTGDELFITYEGQAAGYNLTSNAFVSAGGADGKSRHGGYLDGYFLALDTVTSTLYISNSADVTQWDTGTDFSQRSLAADPWKAMKVVGRYVWLFGELTTEIWQDTGDRFPFAPLVNNVIQYGIAAEWSAAIVGDDVIWLARNTNGRLCVCRAGGVTPEVISTHALEFAIGGYDTWDDAVAWSYSDQGHEFYVLNFDTEGATWVWDAATGIWHERGSWDTSTSEWEVWRPRYHAYAFGEHRILDSRGSKLYQMDPSFTTDVLGEAIRRQRRSPALMSEDRRVFYSQFELDLEPGLGTTGQGENPQVMLRMSDDGGKTWGTEKMRSAGKKGEYGKRVQWNRLGSARRRVFEVTVSDPIPWRLTGAYLRTSVMQGGDTSA